MSQLRDDASKRSGMRGSWGAVRPRPRGRSARMHPRRIGP